MSSAVLSCCACVTDDASLTSTVDTEFVPHVERDSESVAFCSIFCTDDNDNCRKLIHALGQTCSGIYCNTIVSQRIERGSDESAKHQKHASSHGYMEFSKEQASLQREERQVPHKCPTASSTTSTT